MKPKGLKIIIPEFYIRSKTNQGEFAKQSFLAIKTANTEPTLLVRKLVLSNDFELYRDYKLLKQHKDRGLFEQRFGIKLSTLKEVASIVFPSQNTKQALHNVEFIQDLILSGQYPDRKDDVRTLLKRTEKLLKQ